MQILEALQHPAFLIVRVDPQFGGRYARIIHRASNSPSGRTCVLSGESETILAALATINRAGQYTAPGEPM